MKKALIAFGILMTVILTAQTTFAACECNQTSSSCQCPITTSCPCPACPIENSCQCPITTYTPCCNNCNNCNNCCCETWLSKMEDYYCRVGLSECQKCLARRVMAQFLCDTQCLRNCCGPCNESACDCRQYKRELRNLDYEMKKIVTDCQKSNYNCVKNEVKDQVRCCHKCLMWPFSISFGCCHCCNTCCR